jgi:enterochelin esterase-like enzyme
VRRHARLVATLAAASIVAALTSAPAAGAQAHGIASGAAQAAIVPPGAQMVSALPRQGSGHLSLERFYSEALHRRADYMVYVPPGYQPTRRYPVYYLLHGMPGQPQVFITLANMDIRLDALLAERLVHPMILVYPDGRIRGAVASDSEWANTPAGNFESYVIDVMHNVDSRFSTVAQRHGRVIAGFSAGAYGAVNIALHHLNDFGGVQAWSGYYLQTRTGVFAHASTAALAANSPLEDVGQLGSELARYSLHAFLFIGRDDESSLQQAPMVRALQARGAIVGSAVYAGGHQWGVWYPRLDSMLELASQDT